MIIGWVILIAIVLYVVSGLISRLLTIYIIAKMLDEKENKTIKKKLVE